MNRRGEVGKMVEERGCQLEKQFTSEVKSVVMNVLNAAV